jgi:hypothetical protein
MAQTLNLNLEKLDERKNLVLDLKKSVGLKGQKAQVVLVLDRSGSMETLYKNGTVQETLERILPVGLGFDDNGEVDVFLFHHKVIEMPSITLQSTGGYVIRECSNVGYGSTNYAPPIKKVVDKFASTGGLLGMGKSIKKNLQYPVFVIYITDGQCDDRTETEQAIRDASKAGVFFSFVGIGQTNFPFLEKLDDLSGRELDNASFFKVPNLKTADDATIYSNLMKEFPSWILDARAKGMIQ